MQQPMLHVSSNISYDYVTCVSLSSLRRPRDFTSPTSRRGTLYTVRNRFERCLPCGYYVIPDTRQYIAQVMYVC